MTETGGITSGVGDVIDIAGQCVTFLTSNPLCLILIAASLVSIGFMIFRKAKGAAR